MEHAYNKETAYILVLEEPGGGRVKQRRLDRAAASRRLRSTVKETKHRHFLRLSFCIGGRPTYTLAHEQPYLNVSSILRFPDSRPRAHHIFQTDGKKRAHSVYFKLKGPPTRLQKKGTPYESQKKNGPPKKRFHLQNRAFSRFFPLIYRSGRFSQLFRPAAGLAVHRALGLEGLSSVTC